MEEIGRYRKEWYASEERDKVESRRDKVERK
jgi:hypothetical protein